MAPRWAEVAAWIFLGLAFASALVVLVDELVLGYRQRMWIMNVVHPVTTLYLGPLWLWAYFRHGRSSSPKAMREQAVRLADTRVDTDVLREAGASTEPEHVGRWHVSNAVSHCGAGCTLGDIGGEWLVFALGPLTLAGVTLWPELAADFVLAWTLGVAFQYFTIVPMRDVSRAQGVWLAIRVDTLSIVAFQVGLFAWMIVSAKVIWQPPLPVDTATHWWMMQIGMILGFATAYPVNRYLVRSGMKEKMDARAQLADMVDEERRRLERDMPAREARRASTRG